MPGQETSYGTSGGRKMKIRTAKAYSYDDVAYSDYPKPSREEYSAYA
jgi:hypothetical protein